MTKRRQIELDTIRRIRQRLLSQIGDRIKVLSSFHSSNLGVSQAYEKAAKERISELEFVIKDIRRMNPESLHTQWVEALMEQEEETTT